MLVLSGYGYTYPSATQIIDGIERHLDERSPGKFGIDAEFLDLVRISDPEHELRTVTFVREKYAARQPDVVVLVGPPALDFVVKHRDVIAPQVPVVVVGTSPTTYAALGAPSNFKGIFFDLTIERTLELAERLQAQAKRLFIIAGDSRLDRRWQETARRTVEQHARQFETTYLFGLSFEALKEEVSKIPSDSIVVFLTFSSDFARTIFVPKEAASEIARISPAPVYAPYDSYIGDGVVGGFVETFDSHGAAAADLVLSMAAGTDPAALPPRINQNKSFRVDSRAMAKWDLKQSNLPPGTAVLFHQPSLWKQHRLAISAIAMVVALQSALLAALLIQRRRRRRAEHSLKESEDRMTFTATSVNVGLWQFNRGTDELWATGHSRTMLGISNDAPLTRETFLAAVHGDDRRMAMAALRGAFKGQSAVADIRVMHPDGQIRWIRVRARSHLNETGTPNQLAGIFVDITERKASEVDAELQRQEVAHLMRVSVLGELSGAIAHEVNQPLTAILSNAQAALYLLESEPPNLVEVKGALDDIVKEDNHASEVVQRLRGLLRKGESRSELVDVNETVDSTTALLRSELINRRVAIETDLTANLPAVLGDSVQLQQVMLNLVINAMDAMDAMPEAQRHIRISTRETRAGSIEILVKDTGPGIRKTDPRQLFVPFHTTKEHGLGLGLTICSTIVRKLGGTIELRNDEAGGAIARISLPAHVMMMAAQ